MGRLRDWYKRISSGRARVQAPLSLDAQAIERHSWSATVDVAVIGFGGAGAAAAIEARDAGADVTVIERFNGGGSTAISGGIFYAGGGTSIQEEAGIEDSPDNMFNYLAQEVGDVVSQETLRKFCEDSPGNLQWLINLGVPFQASLCPFKTSYPSNDYYFYYSGNESFPPYSDKAAPAPRGHRAHGKGVSGAALFGPMREATLRRDVNILSQHRALGLITDDKGKVIGLQLSRLRSGTLSAWLHRQIYSLLTFSRYAAMYVPLITRLLRLALEKLENTHGEKVSLRTRKGAIISTGGFFYNQEMLNEHAPAHRYGMPLGTIGDDGSGILMGQTVGARTDLMGNVSQWRFINPPEPFIRGLLIDNQGQRVCNEMLYGAQLGEQIMEKAGGQAWLIIDKRLFNQALKQTGPSRAMWFQSATALMYLFLARKKAGSLQELAGKLGIPVSPLMETVTAYNSLDDKDKPDPLGKPPDYHAKLEEGPFYALDCRVDGMVRNPSITLGGLCVDEDTGEVLAEGGGSVAGLYAAGRSAVGVASRSYVSGLSIAGCIFSGRRAGRHAAQRQ